MPEDENQDDSRVEAARPGIDSPQPVDWTASEFVAHDKSAGWYLGLTVVAAIAGFFIYILTRDLVSVGVVIVGAAVLGVYGSHKPRQLEYHLDQRGLTIDGKYYGYDQFKSFSVVPDDGLSAIIFMPLKRFATTLSVYFPPDKQDQIMAVLAASLPYEDARRDTVDSLMKKIRF